MKKTYHLLDAGCSHIVAALMLVFFSFVLSTAIAEPVPVEPKSLQEALETAGWKSHKQHDGTTYLFPAEHPYAHLGHAANGAWTDVPPPNAKALSSIVRQLEMKGYLPIIEAEFEDGVWEVEAYQQGKPVELDIDPFNGKIIEVSVEND